MARADLWGRDVNGIWLPLLVDATGAPIVAASGGAIATDASLAAILAALGGPLQAPQQSGTVYIGGVAYTVNRAFANIAAATTDGALVAGVANRRIRVLAVAALCGGTATNLTFNTKPGGAGVAISCLFANGANGGEVLPFTEHGWFQTAIGEGLTVTTGAGSTTGVQVLYIEV